MPKEFSRSRRVAEEIRRALAQLVHDEVRDPGVGMVTLTAVDLSPDLKHARVYFSVLPDDALATSAAALGRASGYLRRGLARTLKLRVTPDLTFVFDRSEKQGRELDALIQRAVAPPPSREPGDEPDR